VLLNASPASIGAFNAANPGLLWQARGASTQGAVAAVVLGLVTVLLLLVCLVAAAGFAVVAARRQRQLGMLAAVGATRKQLRMVMVAGGAVVGAIAAAAGTAAGLAAWIAAAPRLDAFADHRIDRFNLPWGLVGAGLLLAVLTATAAVVAGVGCLGLAHQARPPLIIGGALAMTIGLLFISPLAIRVPAALGRRAPVAVRVALRDLARHQARSGAALAAISLALGITAAIVISSAADMAGAGAGNLPDTQILVWIGQPDGGNGPDGPVVPARTPAQLGVLAAAVHQIAGSLPHPAVIALDMPVRPADKPQPGGGQPIADLGAPQNQGAGGRVAVYTGINLYVATPAVLHYLGIDPATITPATDFLTVHAGPLVVTTPSLLANVTHVQRIQAPGYTSEPTSLLTAGGLHRRGWTQIQSGWLVESGQALTAGQLAAARDVAAKAGLTIEARNSQASLAAISAAATAAGALLALGVLAMAVGLIRTEAAGDLRTLTAAGATRATRRTLTAVTAGVLALLGALLGTADAYLALAAAHLSDMSALRSVPLVDLALIILAVPGAAALAGWVLAGRQPSSIARRALD
jgi:putative ABC transport system permease protein